MNWFNSKSAKHTKKTRHNRIVEKCKSFIHTSIHNAKLVVSVATCSAVLLTGPTILANETNHSPLDTIFHVYVDGERIGSIDDVQDYEKLAENKIKEYSKQYKSLNLVIGQNVELFPERVFQARTRAEQTLEKLDELLTVKAEAVAIKFDEEVKLFVEEEETAKQVINEFKLQYISEDDWKSFEERKEKEDTIEEPNIGETIIKNVTLSKEPDFEFELAEPSELLSVDEAIKMLKLGTLTEEKYTVSPGDVLGSIASDHQLSTKELLSLNSDITEDTLLQIGQKVNVTAYKPIVTVLVEKLSLIEEEITFQTETREDSSMWKGDSKVVQEGKPGKRIVSYEITEQNGQTIKRQVVDEEVVEEAVNKVVVRGTKQSTSRGTGSLGWPAVGGYISSYQGNRWGRFHKGIDIARPSNYNILSADNGTVISAGWQGGYGNTIRINHNNGIETLYAHLESIDVRVGQTVAKGQKIGIMGTTGNSTGIHLHFEVYQNGKLQNPMDYLNR
ncbi:peptidoglycan DD-metalloendopeptidase family protein [Alkalihalobacterium elongatum]|uniref:peptidoglycan DD-metalloendopeptidase family protein n=1 Tax=Alkalihalobacterium elongatum TaxID=2675466 RepID=UPI001C1FC6EE|nr:peptidoglycan DD-metalloendopeptidase family protein [Alkalihalobacterium elongatum]